MNGASAGVDLGVERVIARIETRNSSGKFVLIHSLLAMKQPASSSFEARQLDSARQHRKRGLLSAASDSRNLVSQTPSVQHGYHTYKLSTAQVLTGIFHPHDLTWGKQHCGRWYLLRQHNKARLCFEAYENGKRLKNAAMQLWCTPGPHDHSQAQNSVWRRRRLKPEGCSAIRLETANFGAVQEQQLVPAQVPSPTGC